VTRSKNVLFQALIQMGRGTISLAIVCSQRLFKLCRTYCEVKRPLSMQCNYINFMGSQFIWMFVVLVPREIKFCDRFYNNGLSLFRPLHRYYSNRHETITLEFSWFLTHRKCIIWQFKTERCRYFQYSVIKVIFHRVWNVI